MTNPVDELDLLVEAARDRNMTPRQLLDLQLEISAIRYTVGNLLTNAEGRYLSEKDRIDLHTVRGKLSLQAKDSKLSGAKAADMVEDETTTEVMRQKLVQARIEYSGLKNRLDNSKDVLVSLAQRVKRAEQEEIESRMQQKHGT